MNLLAGLQHSVERKIILLVLTVGLLPMGLAAFLALKEIESQTLVLAQTQLRESTKTYSLDLFDHLKHAALELQLMHLGELQFEEEGLVSSLSKKPYTGTNGRQRLEGTAESLRLTVYRDGYALAGQIDLDALFASLGHVPAGVERCLVFFGNEDWCAGSLELAETGEDGVISAIWGLPLSSVYETDVALSVISRQSRESALRHVSLVSELLPLLMLLIVTLAGWALIHMIRRRMAPLAELQAATEAIRQGHYDAEVSIHTDDEFEHLGEAFNLMTRRLGRSFEKMSGLADMDRLVLDGSDVDEIVLLALSVASQYYARSCRAYLWKTHRKQGRLYELEEGVLRVTSLCLLPPAGVDRNDVDHREALECLLGTSFGRGAAVRVDGATSGELLVVQDGSESTGDFSTLDELADRISVAVTNMVRAESLYRQANYDSLTGLVNRQAFSDRVGESIQRVDREGQRGAILFLDLDRFKQVNDTEGHLIGDELLRRISDRLSKQMRTTDTVARLGGDEFAIIAPDCGSDGVLAAMCRRLIEAVNEPVEIEGRRHEVDVSIGVSIFPDDGGDVGTLLMKADVAMYQAKSQSGSAFSFYDSSLNDANERRVEIESGLREALSNGLLKLHFQPKLELSSMQVRGLEGLLRWSDGEGFRYNPVEFIPVAEDTGLIHRFTELLVSEVAGCLARCRTEDLEVGRIAINVSTRQFVRQGFARQFLTLLESAKLSPADMEIEVTESLFIHDAEHVTRELAVLRAAGVHIALDDFGTGYSSLNMLRSLPLHTVKIDRSFIAPLRESGDARNVAQKIIEMVSALDLEVVAEGVEHWQEVSLLDRLGCDYVQGYVLEKALPLEDLIPFLKRVQREGVIAEYRVMGSH